MREADKSQGAVRQTDRQQSNEALWRDKSRQVAQCAPLAVTVDGPPLQVQGGLKHLQVMVLQDLAPCCVVLGPIWNLHQNTICLLIKKKIKKIKKTWKKNVFGNNCQHNTTVLQSNTDNKLACQQLPLKR